MSVSQPQVTQEDGDGSNAETNESPSLPYLMADEEAHWSDDVPKNIKALITEMVNEDPDSRPTM